MEEIDYSDILVSLRKIIRSINLESKQIEKEHGISIPQLLCLSYLNKRPDFRATSTELKNFLNLNASTVTGIVSRLEKKGMLARLPKAGDKRVSYIVITSKGAEIIEKIPPLMHDKLSAKLKQLPASKLRDIQSAVHLLIEFMDAGNLDASPMITMQDPVDSVD